SLLYWERKITDRLRRAAHDARCSSFPPGKSLLVIQALCQPPAHPAAGRSARRQISSGSYLSSTTSPSKATPDINAPEPHLKVSVLVVVDRKSTRLNSSHVKISYA